MVYKDEQHCTCMYYVEEMWQKKLNNVQGLEHMRVCKTSEAAVSQ